MKSFLLIILVALVSSLCASVTVKAMGNHIHDMNSWKLEY